MPSVYIAAYQSQDLNGLLHWALFIGESDSTSGVLHHAIGTVGSFKYTKQRASGPAVSGSRLDHRYLGEVEDDDMARLERELKDVTVRKDASYNCQVWLEDSLDVLWDMDIIGKAEKDSVEETFPRTYEDLKHQVLICVYRAEAWSDTPTHWTICIGPSADDEVTVHHLRRDDDNELYYDTEDIEAPNTDDDCLNWRSLCTIMPDDVDNLVEKFTQIELDNNWEETDENWIRAAAQIFEEEGLVQQEWTEEILTALVVNLVVNFDNDDNNSGDESD